MPAARPGRSEARQRELCVEYGTACCLWMRADDLQRAGRPRRHGAGNGAGLGRSTARRGMPQRATELASGADRNWSACGIKALEFFGIDVALSRRASSATSSSSGSSEAARGHGGRAVPAFRWAPTGAGAHRRQRQAQTLRSKAGAGIPARHHVQPRRRLQARWSTASDDGGEAARCRHRPAPLQRAPRVYAFEHRIADAQPDPQRAQTGAQSCRRARSYLVSHSRRHGRRAAVRGRNKGRRPLRSDLPASCSPPTARWPSSSAWARSMATRARRAAPPTPPTAGCSPNSWALDDKRIQVQRFVRVACPARGNHAGLGRLDRWLSVINFLGGAFFGGRRSAGRHHERTDPAPCPGIEAMMPGSRLTRLLHLPGSAPRLT